MAFWTPFFPFGLKWKPLLRRPAMTSIQTFALEIKKISSSFMRSYYIHIYYIHIFHHLRAVNESKIKVCKGKILGPSGVKKLNECYVMFPSAVQWRPFRGSKGHLGLIIFGRFCKTEKARIAAISWDIVSFWPPLSTFKKLLWSSELDFCGHE